MFKNVINQQISIYAHDTANDAPKTGDAGNITAYISLDGGTPAQTSDVNPTELDATNMPGKYVFDLSQGETNGKLVMLVAKSSTANVQIDAVDIYTIDDVVDSTTTVRLMAAVNRILAGVSGDTKYSENDVSYLAGDASTEVFRKRHSDSGRTGT